MSIVRKIHEYYENHPRRLKPPTGWPTGSRLGTCAAQLQLLRVPELSKPEPYQGRTLRVFENGDRIEAWLGDLLNTVYPDVVGLRQEPFFLPVDLDPSQVETLSRRITNRTIWGRVMEHFNEPRLALGEDGRVKARLVPRQDNGKPVNYGFVLDLDRQCVWVPTYIDFAVKHDTLGLTILEVKMMSNYAFRRAALGDLDYSKRCQLVSFARATKANIAVVAYRSETAHLAEISYLRSAERTRVILTKPNGSQEVFFVDPKAGEKTPLVPEAGGEPQGFPADVLWEAAEVQTPYDPALEAAIDERVLRVLCGDGPMARDVALPSGSYRLFDGIHREAGPSFVCEVCGGTGTQTMRKGQAVPLKTPKPCEECANGMLNETELPSFPCGYCSVAATSCYPFARLEIDDRPHLRVTRADWEASGLTFMVPEGSR